MERDPARDEKCGDSTGESDSSGLLAASRDADAISVMREHVIDRLTTRTWLLAGGSEGISHVQAAADRADEDILWIISVYRERSSRRHYKPHGLDGKYELAASLLESTPQQVRSK